jgi:predicted metal-dependent RNase
MANLTFYGATQGVTGSAYLIQTEHSTVLLDYQNWSVTAMTAWYT